MGKKTAKASAQRAKKKHDKDKKRQQKRVAESQRRKLAPGSSTRVVSGVMPRADAWKPAEEGIEGLARRANMHPQEAARAAFDQADGVGIELPDDFWTSAKVAVLDEAALLSRLEALGVRPDRSAFEEAARAYRSAWRIAREVWIPALPVRPGVLDRDFLGLAAVELWRRWCPALPSQEAVIDLFDDGIDALEDDDQALAAERWLDLWDRMKPLLSSEVQTLDAAQKIAGLSAPLFNWAEELATVALDAASERPDVAARASGMFEELLAQFTGETGEVRRELEADRGELLFRGGRPEDGERVLRRVIAAHPAHAVGYATLAREWTRSEAAGRADLQRALALLDEAAQRRVEDAGLWELSARRKELRERLAAAGAAP